MSSSHTSLPNHSCGLGPKLSKNQSSGRFFFLRRPGALRGLPGAPPALPPHPLMPHGHCPCVGWIGGPFGWSGATTRRASVGVCLGAWATPPRDCKGGAWGGCSMAPGNTPGHGCASLRAPHLRWWPWGLRRAEPSRRTGLSCGREVSRRPTMTRICARVIGVTPIASRENRISLA